MTTKRPGKGKRATLLRRASDLQEFDQLQAELEEIAGKKPNYSWRDVIHEEVEYEARSTPDNERLRRLKVLMLNCLAREHPGMGSQMLTNEFNRQLPESQVKRGWVEHQARKYGIDVRAGRKISDASELPSIRQPEAGSAVDASFKPLESELPPEVPTKGRTATKETAAESESSLEDSVSATPERAPASREPSEPGSSIDAQPPGKLPKRYIRDSGRKRDVLVGFGSALVVAVVAVGIWPSPGKPDQVPSMAEVHVTTLPGEDGRLIQLYEVPVGPGEDCPVEVEGELVSFEEQQFETLGKRLDELISIYNNSVSDPKELSEARLEPLRKRAPDLARDFLDMSKETEYLSRRAQALSFAGQVFYLAAVAEASVLDKRLRYALESDSSLREALALIDVPKGTEYRDGRTIDMAEDPTREAQSANFATEASTIGEVEDYAWEVHAANLAMLVCQGYGEQFRFEEDDLRQFENDLREAMEHIQPDGVRRLTTEPYLCDALVVIGHESIDGCRQVADGERACVARE